jgi:Glycosyltransferase family 87
LKIDLRVLVFALAAMYCVSAGTFKASHFSKDLIPIHAGVRCLLHGCDPYDPSQLEQQYFEARGEARLVTRDFWRVYRPVYPPSTFLVLVPLGLFSFPVVRPLWAIFNGALFVVAAATILSACPRSYKWLSAILVSLFLVVKVNISLLAQGNPTPFAIALLIIGTFLFLRGRYIPLAAVAFMLSLAVKPQIGGLIALYLLLKGVHWRWVLVPIAGAVAIFLIAALILWERPGSRNWATELHAGLAESVQPGQENDPRPVNTRAIGIVNLQTITSVLFRDARTYNAVALGTVAAMLVVWAAAAFRAAPSLQNHYLLISALAVVSLLPVYHRSGDDLLLLLTVPAIIHILEKRQALGKSIAALTAMLCVAEFDDTMRMHLVQKYWGWDGILQHKVLFILLLREQGPLLLLLFVFYAAALFTIPVRRGRTYARTVITTT